MKKLFFIALSIVLSHNLVAQENALKIQIGYGIPIGGATIGNSENYTYNGNTSSYIEGSKRGSFGSGTQIEVGYSRSLSGLLAVQLDATYLMGKQYTTYDGSENNNGTITPATVLTNANFFMLSPQLRARFGSGKFAPYALIGPVVGFGEMHDKGNFGDFDSTPYTYEFTYKGAAAIGAKAAVGLEMTVGKFGYFAQLTMINMSYTPTKGVYTKYAENGQDVLSSRSTSQNQVSYVDSYDNYAQQDPNQPSKSIKQAYPFSSLSLSFGVMFHF